MVKLKLIQFLLKTGIFRDKIGVIDAICDGKVKVGGEIIKNVYYRVDPKRKNVYYNGKIIRVKRKVYYLFNKGKGVSCQKNQLNSIYDLINKLEIDDEIKNTLFVIGRLDVDSSGLMIVTIDGLL